MQTVRLSAGMIHCVATLYALYYRLPVHKLHLFLYPRYPRPARWRLSYRAGCDPRRNLCPA